MPTDATIGKLETLVDERTDAVCAVLRNHCKSESFEKSVATTKRGKASKLLTLDAPLRRIDPFAAKLLRGISQGSI